LNVKLLFSNKNLGGNKMRVNLTVRLLILALLCTTAVSVAVADDCVWIDLGEVNDEHGLFQSENGNDGHTVPGTMGNVEYRTASMEQDIVYYMYFGVTDDSADFRASVNESHEAWVVMTYYDTDEPAEQGIWFEYCSEAGAYTRIPDSDWVGTVNPDDDMTYLGGTGQWLNHIWHITDANFTGCQKEGTDIRICRRNGPLFLDWVAVCLSQSAAEGIMAGVEPTMKLATTWGAIKR
jgi:hypothetical protein